MLDSIIEVTDRIRLASLIAVLGSLGALYALIAGKITYVEFSASLAGINAGAGILGIARNGAGHGVTDPEWPDESLFLDAELRPDAEEGSDSDS